MKFPIIVTKPAWTKITQVLQKTNLYAFLFSAKGGGCNGFNYDLKAVSEIEMTNIAGGSRVQLSHMKYKDHALFVDPLSEMLLLGTTIDYVQEDYNQQIYESKFVFTPQTDLATSCGCGVSFSPRSLLDE